MKLYNIRGKQEKRFRINTTDSCHSDRIAFTSQSGKSAIYEILMQSGISVSKEEASKLQPILKSISENSGGGELSIEEIKSELGKLRLLGGSDRKHLQSN